MTSIGNWLKRYWTTLKLGWAIIGLYMYFAWGSDFRSHGYGWMPAVTLLLSILLVVDVVASLVSRRQRQAHIRANQCMNMDVKTCVICPRKTCPNWRTARD